jgi:hypothetical protein
MKRLLLGVLVAALVVAGIGVAVGTRPSKPTKRTSPSTTTLPLRSATQMGTYGVQAAWVVAENKRKGTSAWRIPSTPQHGSIDGFANLTYARVGQSVTLYISTTASSYHLTAYRMGYYQGSGARLVWQSKELQGQVQPTCPLTKGINMVSCDSWHTSITVPVTSKFVQGDYLFKLVGSGGQASYVPLTIWDPSSTATYLVKNDVFTWQAWNPYGGYDFYEGQGTCAATYPPCNRARVDSYDRPYAYGKGAADFLANEYPLISWAEQHGLDVTYVTDVTVEQHPSIVLHHTTLLSLGHDECWSLTERKAAVVAEHAGVNLIFFAASAVLRHVRLASSALGPDRELIDYRDSAEDPLNGKGNPLEVTGNTWSSPPSSWSETAFVGATYAGYLVPGAAPLPMVIVDAANWLFRGTGLHNGSVIPKMLASDFDQFEVVQPHQNNEEIFAHSPMKSPGLQTNSPGGEAGADADMTYYTDPVSHAGVFDTGTNNWIPKLEPCTGANCRKRTIARITGNLFRLFGEGPAGKYQPSVANWRRFYA